MTNHTASIHTASIHTASRAGGLAMGIAAMASVGGSVAVSGVLADAPLFTVQAIRYAAAFLLLLALARAARVPIRAPRGGEWLWLCGVAALGLVLFNVGLVRGSEHAEPAALGVAVACVPVVLALVGPLLEGGRPAPAAVLAAVVVTAGAALVQSGGRTDLAGLGYAALVLACEVGFTLLAVPVLRRHGPWGVSVHTCWIATVQLGALGLVAEGPAAAATLRGPHLAAIAYLAVVLTAIAFILWYSAVGRLGTALAGLLTGVAPVAAAAVGVLLGGPVPGAGVWAGTALVVAGLVLGVRAPRPVGRRREGATAGAPG
ncbi:MAG TPA: DMT family transporter [Pseudonocardia sp.]|jgi:drug/metabolite transporter (DMT)-like permease|uniref:DMT family transporter n=1 Tax=Pseudonocardia sp. TaxID=60912 RepID=UPI002B4AF1E4|nr:DMT family transporter [Pseudonocardia sp.]HLU60453.1 DMT family transporter [Pseudonocardia sp.]